MGPSRSVGLIAVAITLPMRKRDHEHERPHELGYGQRHDGNRLNMPRAQVCALGVRMSTRVQYYMQTCLYLLKIVRGGVVGIPLAAGVGTTGALACFLHIC